MDAQSLIRKHEGLKLKAYPDTEGYLTIGYGHCLDAHNEKDPGSITQEQADKYFETDFAETVKICETVVPHWVDLDEVRKAALLDLTFVVAWGLLKFVKLLSAVKCQDWERASAEVLNSKWARQVGKRSKEVAWMLKTGEWK